MTSTNLPSHCWWMHTTKSHAGSDCVPRPEEQQAIYRRTFVNLPFVNGDDSWELPIPATYVIDRDGTILFASANEDYTERPEPLEILVRLE